MGAEDGKLSWERVRMHAAVYAGVLMRSGAWCGQGDSYFANFLIAPSVPSVPNSVQ